MYLLILISVIEMLIMVDISESKNGSDDGDTDQSRYSDRHTGMDSSSDSDCCSRWKHTNTRHININRQEQHQAQSHIVTVSSVMLDSDSTSNICSNHNNNNNNVIVLIVCAYTIYHASGIQRGGQYSRK